MNSFWLKLVAVITLLIMLGGIWAGVQWRDYQAFLDRPLSVPESGTMLLIRPGMTGQSVVSELERLELTQDDWKWKLLMRLKPVSFQAGEFMLSPGIKPEAFILKASKGEVVQHRFTIVEGWTFRQLVVELQRDPLLGPGFSQWLNEPDIEPNAAESEPNAEVEISPINGGSIQPALRQWLLSLTPPVHHPEGWFMPETYVYIRGDTALNILERAHQATKTALDEIWADRAEALPLDDPYQLLVLASIIEKETALEDERWEISGVFVRRLQKGMRLQTDPTVIYGIGENFDGDIRRKDLRTDTPYNTYTRFGLPPTPIALPGRAALEAAAHPADGTSLFFVANGDGGHTFSETLAEHQKAVDQLLRRK